jgi:hypothetical protein
MELVVLAIGYEGLDFGTVAAKTCQRVPQVMKGPKLGIVETTLNHNRATIFPWLALLPNSSKRFADCPPTI